MERKIPIVILSGFLGSGKTTLLTKMLDYYAKKQLRPAVIMNEIGDVNLDGQLVAKTISMREMLSGCICCTISGDLGMEIRNIIIETSPDLILIEATGVANPMDIFEAVTEAALLVPIDIQAMISVVDAGHLLHWHRQGAGKTYRLMQDQIRCASMLLLNKADLVSEGERNEAKQLVAALNSNVFIHSTVYCEVSDEWFDQVLRQEAGADCWSYARQAQAKRSNDSDCTHHNDGHHEHRHDDHHEHRHDGHHEHRHDEHHGHHHHHSYDHVMVYTHYFENSMNSELFEQFISNLPESVYRAKGIFTEAETGARMMFQYAFRQLHTMRIDPQGSVRDVAVFLGEQFPKHELQRQLEQQLER